MTDAAAAPILETPAPAPAIEPVTSEVMTPEEKAYFTSRGEKTEGLVRAPHKNGNGALAAAEAAAMNAVAESKADGLADGVEPGEISIDDKGNVHDKTGKFVPKSAYLRVKDDAKAAKTDAEKWRDSFVQVRERLNILTEALPKDERTAEAAKVAKKVDAQEDIFGAFDYMSKKVEELEARLEKQNSQASESAKDMQMRDAFKADAAKFSRVQPSFAEAYNYLLGSLHKELEADGVTDQHERDKRIARAARDLAVESLNAGMSPAERIFKRAVARGFEPKAADSETAKKEADARAEIERLNKSQAAAQTLGRSGSGAQPEQLTRAKLADMSDGDFSDNRSKYIAKHGKDAWNRLIGNQ